MKQLMVDNNTAASHSFLLDDDSSIPFSLDDIAALMEDKARGAPPALAHRLDDTLPRGHSAVPSCSAHTHCGKSVDRIRPSPACKFPVMHWTCARNMHDVF